MRHSFSFAGVDMRENFGVLVERFSDVLAPPLRPRKIEMPYRDGVHDFGARYYGERTITIDCATAQFKTRAEARELSLLLAQKGEIRRWDESDKYYIGQIYDSAEIERMAQNAMRFSLVFVCEPFAYGEQITKTFVSESEMKYAGSARTPVRITITNPNSYAISGVAITMGEAIE